MKFSIYSGYPGSCFSVTQNNCGSCTNRNNRFFYFVLCTLLIFPNLQSCATLSDGKQTEMEGTATGAFLGALVGLVVGDNKESVIAGTLVGAVIGNIYGKHVADRKAEYRDNESYMKAMIAESDKVLLAARTQRDILTESIENQKRKLAELTYQKSLGTETKIRLEQQIVQKQKDLKVTNDLITAIDKEIKTQRRVVNQQRSQASAILVSQSETNITSMESEKRQLKLLKAQLASLDFRRVY